VKTSELLEWRRLLDALGGQEDLTMESEVVEHTSCSEQANSKQAHHKKIAHQVLRRLRMGWPMGRLESKQHVCKLKLSLKMVRRTCMNAQILQDTAI
jgi:hypothetical protein